MLALGQLVDISHPNNTMYFIHWKLKLCIVSSTLSGQKFISSFFSLFEQPSHDLHTTFIQIILSKTLLLYMYMSVVVVHVTLSTVLFSNLIRH